MGKGTNLIKFWKSSLVHYRVEYRPSSGHGQTPYQTHYAEKGLETCMRILAVLTKLKRVRVCLPQRSTMLLKYLQLVVTL